MTAENTIQANKLVVQKFLAALGKGDTQALSEMMAADIEAVCTGTSMMAGTRGHAEICAAAGMLSQITSGGIDFQILNLTAESDRVSCEVEGKSTLASGQPYNNQYHFLFFIENGKIVRMREYMDSLLVEKVFNPPAQSAA